MAEVAPGESISSTTLDAELQQYGIAASALAKAPKWRRNWAAYATAGGGALAGAANAQAAVIYSGPAQNVTAAVNQAGTYSHVDISLSFPGGPGSIFGIHAIYVRTSYLYPNFKYGLVGLYTGLGYAAIAANSLSTEARRFDAGDLIGSAQFVTTTTSGRLRGARFNKLSPSITSTLGTWTGPGVTGFAGVAFAYNGGVHFGWIRLLWEDNFGPGGLDAPDEIPDSITAVDWAWEDIPFQPIAAGSLVTTPEPGSALLALLAAGAVGVAAWKRRRAGQPGPAGDEPAVGGS